MNDFGGWTFAQVIDIWFVRESERGDLFPREEAQPLFYFFHYEMWLPIIDLARLIDECCQFRRGLDEEPGVHADAMTAHSRTRAEDIDAWVQVGKADRLPNIHAKLFGKPRELVRNGDVHVAGGVLHQLDHLGGGGIRFHDLAFDEGC